MPPTTHHPDHTTAQHSHPWRTFSTTTMDRSTAPTPAAGRRSVPSGYLLRQIPTTLYPFATATSSSRPITPMIPTRQEATTFPLLITYLGFLHKYLIWYGFFFSLNECSDLCPLVISFVCVSSHHQRFLRNFFLPYTLYYDIVVSCFDRSTGTRTWSTARQWRMRKASLALLLWTKWPANLSSTLLELLIL